MTEEWGSITVYDPSMAARVAQMFNDFNELWPGGFGGGIPYDEQRVHDWLDKTSAIADLIALDPNGEPVGYCGLYPHRSEAHAAYITTLGVVPRVKGNKFGKRLLLKSVEIACERGLRRLDLNTWPGNMDAVPLYKKTGLFWVPDTTVYMQNYIPALFQMPLAREWFGRHPDWYSCFQRELEQSPDRHVVDGMELYTYVFQAGDDRLVGEADRYGWGICGIERTLDGQAISIRTRLRAHDILIGLPNAMTLTVDNRTGSDLSLALTVEAFKGMQWSEPFPLTLAVKQGEAVALTREFVVDKTARTYHYEAAEAIKTRVICGGQVTDLLVGGKIQPAVNLSSQHGYQVAPVGRETTVYLDLANNADQPLAGKVDVFVEGLAGSRCSIDFSLEAKEVSGIAVPVSIPAAPQSSMLPVHAVSSIQVSERYFAMPVYRFPLVADVTDLAVVAPSSDGERLNLLTDIADVHIELKGGSVNLGRRSLPDVRCWARLELGPPFGLSLDRTLKFDAQLLHEGRFSTLVLSANSLQFPNLLIRKYIRVTPGLREIEHWITLTNLQADGAHTVGARFYTRAMGGLSLDPFETLSRSFTPLDGRVIECDSLLPWMTDSMLPQTPEHWPESWTAGQNLANGDFSAWFWKPERVAKIKVWAGTLASLESETQTIQPGETLELVRVWYGFSYASLADVRNRWNQLIGHKELSRREHALGVQTWPPVRVRLAGENIVSIGKKSRMALEICSVTAYPLPGELSLCLPAGWEGAFVTPEGLCPTVPMPELTPNISARIEIALSSPPDLAEASALARLHFQGEYEMDFDLPLLLAGDQEVAVQEQVLEGEKVLVVSNGALKFVVLGEVGGNLIRLQDAQGRAFFADSFPHVLPKFFLTHHIGGVEPLAIHTDANLASIAPEQVTAEACQEGRWKGVQVRWTVENQDEMRGQQFSLSYLTLPGSPLVRIKLEHHNPTPRQIEWLGGCLLDAAFDGASQGMTIKSPGGTQSWVRHPSPKAFFGLTNLREPWSRLSRGDQSLDILALPGFGGSATLFDFHVMAGGFMAAGLETGSFAHTGAEFALTVNQPEGQVSKLLKALAKK